MTAIEVRGWLRHYRRRCGTERLMDLCRILDENQMAADDLTPDMLHALSSLASEARGFGLMEQIKRGGEPRTRWIRWLTTVLEGRPDWRQP